MRRRGWLLDSYLSGRHAVLWLKTETGEVRRLLDRYTPSFYVEPVGGSNVKELAFLFEENPDVYSVQVVEKYASLLRRKLKEVVLVRVDSVKEMKKTLSFARRLKEVKEVYNAGLMEIQWYLIDRGVAPSDFLEWAERGCVLEWFRVLDDGMKPEPPPFSSLVFHAGDSMNRIKVFDGDMSPLCVLEGSEAETLTRLQNLIIERDPDVIVADDVVTTTREIARRAAVMSMDFRFGRRGEVFRGRIFLGLRSFMEVGLAGLVERSRFTLAPMGVSADWAAGKTIDSRQCYEADRLGVLVPEMRGGYGYSSNVWELVARDRGGMIFSPQVGLHENVGCLDFESMFPNIIVRRNVSYETVCPEGVDFEMPGFMGGFTRRFLDRRLHFKHVRNSFPRDSREWLWCEQRQLALKLILVCIYGYSGCYANRFANVRVFQEINRVARRVMVQSLNIALDRGFEVIYGDSDSLFTKRPDATERDYEELAREIFEATDLPIKLDRHFKFLVLLSKTSDSRMEAARRYFGKLTDGSLFYRGVELRRHDAPPFVKRLQEQMMGTLFDAESSDEVLTGQLPKVYRAVDRACREISNGKVDPECLVISKRLRRELSDYKSLQPHVAAARLDADVGDHSNFIFVDADNRNPFLRVMPASMLNGDHRRYDRKKYVSLVRRSAENLLRTLVLKEAAGGMKPSSLDEYLD